MDMLSIYAERLSILGQIKQSTLPYFVVNSNIRAFERYMLHFGFLCFINVVVLIKWGKKYLYRVQFLKQQSLNEFFHIYIHKANDI